MVSDFFFFFCHKNGKAYEIYKLERTQERKKNKSIIYIYIYIKNMILDT